MRWVKIFTFGVSDVLRPEVLLYVIFGTYLGLIAGILPGLTASFTIVILLPFLAHLNPVVGIGMLMGVVEGGFTGGGFTATLLNIPGTPSAAATALDGYPMAKNGRAGEAIGMVIFASVIGGLLSRFVLVWAAPQLGKVTMGFGAPEIFAFTVLGITLVAAFSEQSLLKGIIMGILGLMFATVGVDPVSGLPRLTGGLYQLEAGVLLIPAMVGMFAIPQIVEAAMDLAKGDKLELIELKGGRIFPSLRSMWQQKANLLWGSAIGTVVGAIPGASGPVASFLSYDLARRRSKYPEKFGTGIVDGISSTESANNAVAGGALIPLLTLGIPGDTVTAVLLGALVVMGFSPGPLFMTEHADMVSAIFATLLLANIASLIVCFTTVRVLLKIIKVPPAILMPLLTVLTVIGSYSMRNLMFDVYAMLFFGIVGLLGRRFNFPVVPLLLGTILGPILEVKARVALMTSREGALIFVNHPVSLAFLILSLIILFSPALKLGLARIRVQKSA